MEVRKSFLGNPSPFILKKVLSFFNLFDIRTIIFTSRKFILIAKQYLVELSYNPLQEEYYQYSGITDKFIEKFLFYQTNTIAKLHLELSDNCFFGLISLNLSFTNVSIKGIELLLFGCKSLKKLTLLYSESIISHIVDIDENKINSKLTELYVIDCCASHEYFSGSLAILWMKISKLFPELRVFHSNLELHLDKDFIFPNLTCLGITRIIYNEGRESIYKGTIKNCFPNLNHIVIGNSPLIFFSQKEEDYILVNHNIKITNLFCCGSYKEFENKKLDLFEIYKLRKNYLKNNSPLFLYMDYYFSNIENNQHYSKYVKLLMKYHAEVYIVSQLYINLINTNSSKLSILLNLFKGKIIILQPTNKNYHPSLYITEFDSSLQIFKLKRSFSIKNYIPENCTIFCSIDPNNCLDKYSFCFEGFCPTHIKNRNLNFQLYVDKLIEIMKTPFLMKNINLIRTIYNLSKNFINRSTMTSSMAEFVKLSAGIFKDDELKILEMNKKMNLHPDYSRKLILNFLIENYRFDLFYYFVEIGYNITQKDEVGWNPLFSACSVGRIDIVNFLIDKKLTINDIDIYSYTPLHLAAQNNHSEVVDLLIKQGAKRSICNNKNRNFLQIAESNGNQAISKKYSNNQCLII